MAHHPHAPYRIWVAGENEWLPGPSFPDLESALSNARQLAHAGDVALELPTRQWHTFKETGSNRLGPAQFAKGSDPNLGDRASAAVATRASTSSRTYSVNLNRSTLKAAGGTIPGMGDEPAQPQRFAAGTARRSEHITHAGGTNPGLGPARARRSGRVSTQRAAARSSGVYLSTSAGEGATPRPVARRATAPIASQREPKREHKGPERREATRFNASDVLEEPACAIQAHRTEIVDVSETGMQIMVPAGVKIQIARPVTLVFSGKQGCFELSARGAWARGRYAGVVFETVGGNVVGRMFLRKMIARWQEREKKRKERKPRRGH